MGIVGEKLDIDFVISTGDNFYDSGLTGVEDPAFQESFTNIYTAPSLQKQWYIGKCNIPYNLYIFILVICACFARVNLVCYMYIYIFFKFFSLKRL